jgi:hypothetical protein
MNFQISYNKNSKFGIIYPYKIMYSTITQGFSMNIERNPQVASVLINWKEK